MQINGPNKNAGKHLEQTEHRRVDTVEVKATSDSTTKKTSAGDGQSTHVSSPQLNILKQQLQDVPEVRAEVVNSVSNRVAAGEFSGFDIAVKTAAAMLKG